ncbi:hypothetical protein [Hoeflea ulvae]|uniref:Uncharacterized protein n=1 Tax=Hoeflea ulvae TaxID=2983764 RepID=A0ABT3Y9V8_9HYPH|nr:hypothetical protein [Hoeflea ulvae]MCY0092664.1 hypothetical protein [Hoeflea ulvae]
MTDWSDIADKISATITLLKQTSGLVKDVAPLVQNSEAKAKLSEVREQLLDASERVNDLRAVNNEIVDRNLQLEGEIREIKSFLSKKDSYVPYRLERGAFVYVAENSPDGPEKAPWYCQHCFEVEHRLSPMNYRKEAEGRSAVYACQSCKAETVDYGRSYYDGK